jgi:hypothetical protein
MQHGPPGPTGKTTLPLLPSWLTHQTHCVLSAACPALRPDSTLPGRRCASVTAVPVLCLPASVGLLLNCGGQGSDNWEPTTEYWGILGGQCFFRWPQEGGQLRGARLAHRWHGAEASVLSHGNLGAGGAMCQACRSLFMLFRSSGPPSTERAESGMLSGDPVPAGDGA